MREFLSTRVVAIFLYLQTIYTLWVFFREAKFFRLPYILLSSLWNGGLHDSLPFRREIRHMVHDGPTIRKCTAYNGIFSDREVGGRLVVTYSEEGKVKRMVVDRAEISDLRSLNSMHKEALFTEQMDVLLPGVCIINPLSKSEMFQRYFDGYRPRESNQRCFVDQSSGEWLNDTFMRLLSIVPVYLQARNENSLSIVVFILIVGLDTFSYFPNLIWKRIKSSVFYRTKIFLTRLGKDKRVFLHTFLSTISEGFMYCDESRCCTYHTDLSYIYVQEPFIVPDFVTGFEGVERFGLQTNKDGKVNEKLFVINDNEHLFRYRYDGVLQGTYTYKAFLNGSVIIEQYSTDETAFEEMIRFHKEVEEMGMYPAQYLNENSIHLIPAKMLVEELYDYRGLKVLIKEGVLVSEKRITIHERNKFVIEKRGRRKAGLL